MRTIFPTLRRGDIEIIDISSAIRKGTELIQDCLDKGMQEEQIQELIKPLVIKLAKQLGIDKSKIKIKNMPAAKNNRAFTGRRISRNDSI